MSLSNVVHPLIWVHQDGFGADGALDVPVPATKKIQRILMVRDGTPGNAVTGVTIGSASGGSDIMPSENIAANEDLDIKLDHILSNDGEGNLYFTAAGGWNSATFRISYGYQEG